MKNRTILLVGLFAMLVLIPSVHADVFNCSSCLDCSQKIQSANSSDVIVLTADINSSSGASCIDFGGKDEITLDCDGHSITNTGGTYDGIYNKHGYNNVIKNCTIIGFRYGIYLAHGGSNIINDSTFLQNSIGITLYSSDSNIIRNVTLSQNSIGISVRYDSDYNIINNSFIVGNYEAGISFSPRLGSGDPEYNQIYNNYFSNSGDGNIHVVKISTEQDRILNNSNYFNTSQDCSGYNIMGCNCIGGNYWTSPSGNGFSDTCTDTNSDGICDDHYNFSSNGATMIDWLPLTVPAEGCCANPDRDGDGYISTICGGDDCDDDPIACGASCYPGAIEVCDGYDNNCDGSIDEDDACAEGDILLIKRAHYPTIIQSLSCAEDSSTHELYCFGGVFRAGTDKPQTDLIVKYDPATDTVTNMTSTLPTIRDRLSCVEDSSTHRIYCFGGYWQEFFCTQWEPWGCVAGYSITHYLNDILEYNPSTDTLTTMSETLPSRRYGLSCVEDSHTHRIYCFGGKEYGSSYNSQILEYDPFTDTLTTMSATLPSGRCGLSCVEDSSTRRIYCFGGRNSSGILNETVEYDPVTDTLITKSAKFPVGIEKLSCAENSVTHRIYCFGGYTDRWVSLDSIFEYDPATDMLTLMGATFPKGRHSLFCAEDSATHRIYCFGGGRNVVCFDEITEYISYIPQILCGDLDGNALVDATDLQLLLAHVFTGRGINEWAGDVDGNGYINILDARLLMNHITNPAGYPLNCTCEEV